MTSIMPTYNRYPVTFVSGEGAYLTTDDGRQFLDGLSGIAVCVLGHAHPAVADALATQAKTLVHTSNLYGIPEQEKLAATLCEISGMDNVFFCNSGAESNEAALKLARKYGNDQGVEVPTTLVIEGSFHGRTLATLTATGQPKVRAGFEPLPLGFEHVPFNDIPCSGSSQLRPECGCLASRTHSGRRWRSRASGQLPRRIAPCLRRKQHAAHVG